MIYFQRCLEVLNSLFKDLLDVLQSLLIRFLEGGFSSSTHEPSHRLPEFSPDMEAVPLSSVLPRSRAESFTQSE